uniref:Uncharacterized protein n=1 Tax=Arundo donax TaxID=35708 RepID=A0A0A9AJ95_ARUDO
MPFLCYQVI